MVKKKKNKLENECDIKEHVLPNMFRNVRFYCYVAITRLIKLRALLVAAAKFIIQLKRSVFKYRKAKNFSPKVNFMQKIYCIPTSNFVVMLNKLRSAMMFAGIRKKREIFFKKVHKTS